jgi:hypothetical protein
MALFGVYLESIELRAGGKAGCDRRNLAIIAKLFERLACLCDRCERTTFGSIASFAIYSRTTKPRFICGFVDFFNDACCFCGTSSMQSSRHSRLE